MNTNKKIGPNIDSPLYELPVPNTTSEAIALVNAAVASGLPEQKLAALQATQKAAKAGVKGTAFTFPYYPDKIGYHNLTDQAEWLVLDALPQAHKSALSRQLHSMPAAQILLPVSAEAGELYAYVAPKPSPYKPVAMEVYWPASQEEFDAVYIDLYGMPYEDWSSEKVKQANQGETAIVYMDLSREVAPYSGIGVALSKAAAIAYNPNGSFVPPEWSGLPGEGTF